MGVQFLNTLLHVLSCKKIHSMFLMNLHFQTYGNAVRYKICNVGDKYSITKSCILHQHNNFVCLVPDESVPHEKNKMGEYRCKQISVEKRKGPNFLVAGKAHYCKIKPVGD